MATQLVQHSGSELSHGNGWSRERVDLLKRMYFKGSTDDEFALFLQQCYRTKLDPFIKQIYAVKRWNSKDRREEISFQVSIDGFRLTAQRTGKYAGQLPPMWCGADGKWTDVWLSDEPPAACKCFVLHADMREPVPGIVYYKHYVQLTKEGNPNQWWSKCPGPAIQLWKCAEASALRRAFPAELSGIYTEDEMGQADNPQQEQRRPAPKTQGVPTPGESLETSLRDDLSWMNEKVGTQAAGEYTWDDMAVDHGQAVKREQGKPDKVMGGRSYLHSLENYKDRPDLAVRAKIALAVGKDRALADQPPVGELPEPLPQETK